MATTSALHAVATPVGSPRSATDATDTPTSSPIKCQRLYGVKTTAHQSLDMKALPSFIASSSERACVRSTCQPTRARLVRAASGMVGNARQVNTRCAWHLREVHRAKLSGSDEVDTDGFVLCFARQGF